MLFSLDGALPDLPEEGQYWVAPSASIIGRVELGADVSVWFGAVIRGDNEPIRIGERSNIQDGSVLHSDHGFPLSIGADVTVGHQAMLHGCTVEAGCLIGIGATILNGARIGEGSIVGAHALITENKTFPPRSLIVGSPGKRVREVTEAECHSLREQAAHYVENWKRFATGLREFHSDSAG